ncbi:hypothetical protein GYMLUDRAFT_77222 [Collybiopsis luxurians FD-317 M1]|uniref:Manganese lipoxygenase n=1 Tax=Collybiopsis luxurians FD-317 M1 TaxID=944289 RepID=A0A0D0BWS2_9AGAR|nr:hypothetical protein GYMLUDRAFT_77222 [Collybiopsis luxurians FD-317 M1]
MYFSKNIGHRDDWYSDAVFGQQQFTGTNPTTIALAPSRWIEDFGKAARFQGRGDIVKLFNSEPENLFIQDHSDFRSIVGLLPSAEISSDGRYGCSSITLFHLNSQGKLHPLAIVLDYKGSMEKSVVSDWFRHELVVHLVYTHLVEEVLIVAARRTLPSSHIVLKLLEPHWKTTLSLNEAARSTLVPKIINGMTGFKDAETYAFIKDAYQRFDWVGSYVPNDLRRRGFPVEKLNDVKYHNYGYARNIARMWKILREFVGTVLTKTYTGSDAQVAADLSIASFCNQVRSIDGGQLSNFPSIRTLDELIDFVTMCIHIASPQHTAVNYLQQYYQTFVPNKPSALFRPLPQSLAELEGYGEKDILDALPSHRSRDWLLMAQVPYLLSMEVAEDSTILHYASTTINSSSTPRVIREAAEAFKNDLQVFAQTVLQYSEELDDQQTPYLVLDPYRIAISILI